jgi:hypothetical protein
MNEISHSVVLKKCWSEDADIHTIIIQREDGYPLSTEEIVLLLKQYIMLVEKRTSLSSAN